MGAFTGWSKGRTTLFSGLAIAVLAGVPIALAIVHQGFPVSDVDLSAQNVWVTNGQRLLGGRLNHQINELDAKVTGTSSHLDVLQDGGETILSDTSLGTVQVIDPAFVSLTQKITVPVGSQLSYGSDTLAILSPDGRLWVLDSSAQLSFDAKKTPPVAKLGTGSQVVVSKTGSVFALSATRSLLYSIDHPGASVSTRAFTVPSTYQLSAVGDHPVVLDPKADVLIREDGSKTDLHADAIRLQQAGPDNSYAIVATGSSLLEVPLGGGAPVAVSAKITVPTTSTKAVSAPVFLDGCAYGAWADAQKYLYACDGKAPVVQDLGAPSSGNDLEFRVNHGVIALNDLQNGNAWLVSSAIHLVNNWAQLDPDDVTTEGTTGEEKPVTQSFEDAVANRTTINHSPVAVDDDFGARPGRTTVLPVLDNDTDEDGDVLTITAVDALPASLGTVDVIEGGRALQYTPPSGDISSASFRYTITDGRTAYSSAQVTVAIHPLSQNVAPVQRRPSTATVEVGQAIGYDVLNDWIDPDGDDIYLVTASATTPDLVQFTPSGTITFTSKTGQTGAKQVSFTVSDGHATATGSLEVDVKAAGTLDPVAVPDFATGVSGAPVVLHPLDNDLSPSGDTLSLVGAKLETGTDGVVTTDQQKSTITFQSNTVGSYYLTYTVGAGSHSVQGIALVVISNPSSSSAAPIAVKDDAYVRPGEPTSVDVLANDLSPAGRVLVVESVTKGDDASALNVELLGNSVVRVTAPGVLAQQVQLTYTISDGFKTATAGITVVPIPPLVNHQAPVAVPDSVTVRAGDIASVHVLDNDYSPDAEPFTLDPALSDVSGAGQGATAFVSGSLVRYQAPSTAGTYSVTYGITDKFGQRATTAVTFVVTAKGGKNQAPEPQTLTARAFAGSAIPIDVPLDGLDADGDSVTFDGIATPPTLGRVIATSATSFTYQAYPASAGTDQFTYQVEDSQGKTAIGTVEIGVIPRPSTAKPPTAVDDKVEIKPGKTASVPVLLNDSDPNGYELSLKSTLPEVQAPLKAHVSGAQVIITAPDTEGAYVVRYQVTNGQGGSATAFIQVLVTKDATPVYPTAADHIVDIQQLTGKSSVSVNVLDGAQNPSGVVGDLKVAVRGPNASAAVVQSDGTVVVTPGEHRMAITYSLTDPATGLAGDAFIVMPPKPGSADASTAPPHIKNGLTELVKMNGTGTYKLADIVSVPSGRSVTITKSSDTAATNALGSPYVNGQTLTFTPAKDYRGPAAITFKVDDGKDPGETEDRITLLTLPITVGSPDQSDVPPTFTPPTVEIQAGEAAQTIDLRDSTYQPNPQVLSQITYSDFSNSNADVESDPSGSKLSLSAAFGVQPGSVATIKFTVNSGDFHIPGQVNVKVVSSSRPLATQKSPDPQTIDFKRGGSGATLSGAVSDTYWINPFSGQALTIIGAKEASGPAGAVVSYTANSITVSAGSGVTTGAVNVTYTVQDATKDPARNVTGQLTATIHDVPDAPPAPSNVAATDGQATMQVTAPADNHGLPIDQYRITTSPGGATGTLTSTGTYTATGLANGTKYTFSVEAHNSDGWSAPSPASAGVTPYGTPGNPTNVTITNTSGGYATTTVKLTWDAPSVSGGGTLSYTVSYDGGAAAAASSGTTRSAGAGQHSFTVYATNSGGKSSGTVTSNTITVDSAPPPQPKVTLSRGADAPGTGYYYHVHVENFGSSVTLKCYDNSGDRVSSTVYTEPDGFDGDLSCYSGFPNYWVTANNDSVKSNTVTGW